MHYIGVSHHRLFIKQFVQDIIKENNKVVHYWHLVRHLVQGILQVSLTKWLPVVMQKAFPGYDLIMYLQVAWRADWACNSCVEVDLFGQSCDDDSRSASGERYMMVTSLNGNIFCVTGTLWGESIAYRWIPLTKASDAELWCFLWFAPGQTIEQTIETQVICDAIALIMTSM